MKNAKESLQILLDGNKRFAEHKSIHPNRCDETRATLLEQQNPFAVILSCSDSRVPIEIIFDVGLGDVFTIRTAGHVLSPEVMGSIEYAVKHLDCKLIMILGHDNCGAINSAIKAFNKPNHKASDNLQSILNHIYPVLEKIPQNQSDILNLAIKSNVKYQVADLLKKDEYIAQKVKNEEIIVVGANYELKTGLVKILD
ncbi:MAG: carbonic anhydrase [bacterium]|nr:carbonic anhydrase [bacterium]